MCIFKECGGAYLFYNKYTAITAYILVHRNYHKCEFFFQIYITCKMCCLTRNRTTLAFCPDLAGDGFFERIELGSTWFGHFEKTAKI